MIQLEENLVGRRRYREFNADILSRFERLDFYLAFLTLDSLSLAPFDCAVSLCWVCVVGEGLQGWLL